MVDRRLHGLMVLVVHNQDHQFLLFLFRDSHAVLHRHQVHLHFQVFFFRLLTPRILLAIIEMMVGYKSYRLKPSRENGASQLLDQLDDIQLTPMLSPSFPHIPSLCLQWSDFSSHKWHILSLSLTPSPVTML